MNNLNRYLFAVLLSAYLIKVGISGASVADAVVLLVLAGLHAALEIHANSKKNLELKQALDSLSARLDAKDKQDLETYQELKKMGEDTRNAVAGIKMGAGFKAVK